MLYCKNCLILFEGENCPVCGAKSDRGPAPDDPVFLVEKEQIWSEVLSDALEKNGVPFYTKGLYGAGMAMKIGPMFEKTRFYVLFKDLDRARETVDGMFSGASSDDN